MERGWLRETNHACGKLRLISYWNCSCHGDGKRHRDRLILPSLVSSRIYVVDTGTNARAPSLHKVKLHWRHVSFINNYVGSPQVVESEEVKSKSKLSTPHTSHCLADGNIMISAMGDTEGNAKGRFKCHLYQYDATCTCTPTAHAITYTRTPTVRTPKAKEEVCGSKVIALPVSEQG